MSQLDLEKLYDSAIYKVINKAGGITPVAKALSVSRQAVYEWLYRGFVPPGRAVELEKLYGIPRHTLVAPKLRALFENESMNGVADLLYIPRK